MVKYCTIIGMKILKCFEEFNEEYSNVELEDDDWDEDEEDEDDWDEVEDDE